jgi:dienelactone hydrolase
VLTFHVTPEAAASEEAKQIKAELLIDSGAGDPMIGADDVAAFKKLLDGAGAKYEFIARPGLVRSLRCPRPTRSASPAQYNNQADEKSWQAMKELPTEKLGN